MANPTDAEIEADPVRARNRHEVRCKHFGLDPDTTTPEELRVLWDAACAKASGHLSSFESFAGEQSFVD